MNNDGKVDLSEYNMAVGPRTGTGTRSFLWRHLP